MMVPMGMGDTFSRNFRKMNHSLKDRLIRHMEDGRYEPQSKSAHWWTRWRRKENSCGYKRADTL